MASDPHNAPVEFDPYAEWLNIPPDRRPPTHYDLLGLEPGAPDPERLRCAVEEDYAERYRRVRVYAADKDLGAIATRVLEELAAARLCLSDPEKKAEYDLSRDLVASGVLIADGPTIVAAPPPLPPLPAEAASRSDGKPLVPAPPIAEAPPRRVGGAVRALLRTPITLGSLWAIARGLGRVAGAAFIPLVWVVRGIDRVLAALAGGSENTILHNFLRLLTVAGALLAFVLGTRGLTRLPFTILTAAEQVARSDEAAPPPDAETPDEVAQPSDAASAASAAGAAGVPTDDVTAGNSPQPPSEPEVTATPLTTGLSASPAAPASTSLPGAIVNSIGMTLALVPAGEFRMGALDSRSRDDRPQHRVRITRPFYLGVYEVTQAEYRQVMGSNPSHFCSTGLGAAKVAGEDTSRHPVEMVSWDEATEFCRKLSEMPAERSSGRSYRLPTEAEWEYACGCGGQEPETSALDDAAWHKANSGDRTHPVGQKRASAWGLCDMRGNVYEWCADRYAESYYATSQEEDPTGPPQGDQRVLRGGNWRSDPTNCVLTSRAANWPGVKAHGYGFRVACRVGGELASGPAITPPPAPPGEPFGQTTPMLAGAPKAVGPQPRVGDPNDPFAGLPEAVDLPNPPIGRPATSPPTRLGRITCGPNDRPMVTLAGLQPLLSGSRSARLAQPFGPVPVGLAGLAGQDPGAGQFVLSSENAALDAGAWVVRFLPLVQGGQIDAARVWIRDDDLWFQWNSPATPSAGLLRYSVLEFRLRGQSRALALCKPVKADPITIDLDTGTSAGRTRLFFPLDRGLLRLEGIRVEGFKDYRFADNGPPQLNMPIQVQFTRALPNRRGLGAIGGGQQFVSAQAQVAWQSQAGFDVQCHVVVPNPAQVRMWKRLNVRDLHRQLEVQSNHYASAPAPRKRELEGRLTQIETQLWWAEFIEAVNKRAKIHYRIVLPLGTHRLVLAATEEGTPPEKS